MSSYTPYHVQATPENIDQARAEFWPMIAERLAAAFALLVPYLRGAVPRAVMADVKAKLKPLESLARRFFLLEAMVELEAAEGAEPRQTDVTQAHAGETDTPAAPRKPARRDPYTFKLSEPWPNLLPTYDDAFDADWADAAFAGVYASPRALIALHKRMKALNAALEDPAKQIARMRRWLASRIDLRVGRRSPLALGPPPGWDRKKKNEPLMRGLALTHQFQRMRFYPP